VNRPDVRKRFGDTKIETKLHLELEIMVLQGRFESVSDLAHHDDGLAITVTND
jgi:hypothetical protein